MAKVQLPFNTTEKVYFNEKEVLRVKFNNRKIWSAYLILASTSQNNAAIVQAAYDNSLCETLIGINIDEVEFIQSIDNHFTNNEYITEFPDINKFYNVRNINLSGNSNFNSILDTTGLQKLQNVNLINTEGSLISDSPMLSTVSLGFPERINLKNSTQLNTLEAQLYSSISEVTLENMSVECNSFSKLANICKYWEIELHGKLTIKIVEFINGTSLQDCEGVKFAAYLDGKEYYYKAFTWELDTEKDIINIASQQDNIIMFTENNEDTICTIKCSKATGEFVTYQINPNYIWQREAATKYNIPLENLMRASEEWEDIKYSFDKNSTVTSWIFGNNSAWFDTEYILPNSTNMYLDLYCIIQDTSGDKKLFGAVPGYRIGKNGTTLRVGYDWNGPIVQTNTPFHIIHENGTSTVGSFGTRITTGSDSTTAYVFASRNESQRTNDGISYILIKDQGVTTKMFVPFYKNNEYGMLELVSYKFYGDATSNKGFIYKLK